VDLALLADETNLQRFERLLSDLQAERIAVPPFTLAYLQRGHAIHFRCRDPQAENLRVDVMAVMRGLDPFPDLWERRTTAIDEGGETFELLSLPDLVKAKKTQRDKDWPMIRRLLEANYFAAPATPTEDQVRFWLREMRTPSLLRDVAHAHAALAGSLLTERPLLAFALAGDPSGLAAALAEEERAERERDRAYWEPLRRELERLRRQERQKR
jgi:hypothetical protein